MKKNFLFGILAILLAGFGFGGISLATDYTGSLVSSFDGDPITTYKLILKVGEGMDNGVLQGDNIQCHEGNICEILSNTGKEVQLPEPLLSGKESCTFAGWYSNYDDTKKGGIGDTFKLTSTTTLYAKWLCDDSGFQVRNQHFDTFEAALAALLSKYNDKIVLLQDVSYAMTDEDTFFRIEKNGHNITVTPAEGYVMNTPVETNGYVEYKQVKYSDQLIEITKADGAISYSTSLSLLNGDGSTVKLLKDNAVVTSIPNAGSSLRTDADVTLDLNGYTLNLNTTTNRNYAMSVTEGNTLTIKNGTIEIAPTNTKKENGIIVEKGSTLNIGSDVAINAHNGVSAVSVFGDVTLNLSGTLTAENSFVIAGNGSNGNEGYTINIDGGSVIETTNTAAAIYHPNNGTLNISTGTIQGSEALYIKSGETNISGGKFIGKGAKADFSHNGNGANPTGDGVVVEVCDYPGGEPTINITAGEFESDNADAIASYAQEGYTALTGFLVGGIFSPEPDEPYISDGYYAKEIDDDKYEISEIQEITSIDITGITTPVAGTTRTLDGIEITTTPEDAITIESEEWTVYPADNSSAYTMATGETFNTEDSYSFSIVYRLKTGYKLSNTTTYPENSQHDIQAGENPGYYIVIPYDDVTYGYTVTWKNGEDVLETDENVANGSHPSYDGARPTKAATSSYTYTFSGWSKDGTNVVNLSTETITGDTIYTAVFTQKKRSGGGGGGGGSSSTTTNNTGNNTNTGNTTQVTTGDAANTTTGDTVTDETNSNEENNSELNGGNNEGGIDSDNGGDNDSQSKGVTYSQEFRDAYNFAFNNGITTMPNIEKADMEGGLTRIAMAKMLSQYAINILKKTPDTSRTISFPDVSEELDAQYDNGVTLAYQLGIMGIGIEEFRPFDNVTRAEFVTALSRLLFGTADGEGLYYETHMKTLFDKGIITVTDPNLQELRGYVMIMLMRSAED